MSKAFIVYYTDSKLHQPLAEYVREILKQSAGDIPIISVSQKPLDFGTNVCVGEKPRKPKSIFEQIRAGMEFLMPEHYIFLCEHDVLYHPSHFVTLPSGSFWLFNANRCLFWIKDGLAHMEEKQQRPLSHGCVKQGLLMQDLRSNISKTWRDKNFPVRRHWKSLCPNLDLRHEQNFTHGRYLSRLRKQAKKIKLDISG